ncbi:MAG: protein translocase subunit SecD [Halobacteriovoraceae bacterium]|nr:protein translocase subunit SecD [Halobacteriovoraceae bacterium]MCB9095157.1 protein translocase subunit SecD [Halobacteriovoraceae bacterium]
MKRNWWYKFLLMLFVVVITSMSIVPTFFPIKEGSSYPVKSKINLGLDLQGGLYIVLGIDFNKVYKDEVEKQVQRAVSYLEEEEDLKGTINDFDLKDINDPQLSISFASDNQKQKAHEIIKERFSYHLRLTSEVGSELKYGINTSLRNDIEKNAVTKSIEVIRNRIDEFGVNEPEIISQGEDRIVVQLPGVKDIDRAKSLIGKTAKLEFKLVNDEESAGSLQEWLEKAKEQGIEYKKGELYSAFLEKINTFLKDDIPKGYEVVFEKIINKKTNDVSLGRAYLVEKISKLSGDDLQEAAVTMNRQDNMPEVSLEFKSDGAKRFEDITGKNVGKRLAIILDGNVYSAPSINGRIAGGHARITLGQGTQEEILKQARDLALVLRAGALPVELEFQEQRIVGPSLGADSIKKAEFGGMIGIIAVFLFILVYYKVSGVIAAWTLLLNILIVLGCLVGLEATLTLPGIAGIVLTIGMAVDANIIIFERIREELEAGASARAAVESGFGKAFWTILDANLTTAVAGIALLNFGTGPIRGFAVTLLIGIAATIYCSYFVGKLMFEFYMERVKGQSVSI